MLFDEIENVQLKQISWECDFAEASDELRPDKKWEDIFVSSDIRKGLEFFIKYLKDPREYSKTGVRAPRGANATLNALLTEMDGFKRMDGKPVFVMAATNLNAIDAALVRRFDRSFVVGLPNAEGPGGC